MNDISLTDVLYTGGMLFLVFYGAMVITKILSNYIYKTEEEDEEAEK